MDGQVELAGQRPVWRPPAMAANVQRAWAIRRGEGVKLITTTAVAGVLAVLVVAGLAFWNLAVALFEAVAAVTAWRRNTFAGVTLERERNIIKHGRKEVTLAGAHARVDTSGALMVDRRVTITRLLIFNIFAFALRKKRTADSRGVFLSITGPGGAIVVKLPPSRETAARDFAARINSAAA